MYDMKNPVRIGIPGLFSFRGNHWPLLFSVFLTAGTLHAQQIPDWLLSATPDSFDLPGWSSPSITERDFGNLHISLLSPTPNSLIRPSLALATSINGQATVLHPAVTAGGATNWINPGTSNWFNSRNWSNGVPTSTSVVVVADGGTAQIQPTPSPTVPPGTKPAKRITTGSATPNLTKTRVTAEVGSLTIGSINGPGGTVIENKGILDVFQGLTVQANGTLKSLTGIAAKVHGGTVTNSGTIIGIGDAIAMDQGGTISNNQNAVISGEISLGSSNYGIRGGNAVTGTGVTHVFNSGSISGGTAIALMAGGTIVNNATGKIEGIGGGGVGIQTHGAQVDITNSGVISANSTGVIIGAGGSLTNEAGGSITSTTEQAIILTGGNESIINLGTITGGKGVAIDATLSSGNTIFSNGGTVHGSVELGAGVNTVTLVTGGTIKGDLNLGPNSGNELILDGPIEETISQAVTGAISGLGSLSVQGGTWIIDEDLAAPVSTDVITGILSLGQSATLTTPALTIENGGTLMGTGTIGGNVINSGVISPGNPFGTLTIRGNFTQTGNGVFRLELGGTAPGDFGQLAVTGRASLNGTLQLVPVGNFQFMPGDKLVFLTAGSVTGSFSSITNLNTIVNAKVLVLANAVELTGTQGDFVTAACNPNSVAVARALNSVVGDPRAAALITFLDNQPLNQLCADFTLISPEALTSVFDLAVSLANVQSANLERRLDDLRQGSHGFSSSGFTINDTAPSFSQGLSGPTGSEGKSGPSVVAPIPENRWGFFATGLGEFTDVSTADGARGFNFRTGGVTVGVDYRIGSNFAIGLTGGYAHTGVDLSGNGNINVDGGTGGFYATAFGNGFYVDTSVTGGASNYDTRRTALLGTATGSTDGGNLNVLVAGGYDWTSGALTIGPIASFQYTYSSMNGFTETGSLAPLRFSDQNVDSIRTALGIKLSYDLKIGGVLIRPEVRASWQHEYADSAYSIVANFANGAGNSFNVVGPELGRDSLLIGAGVAVLWNDRISTYVYYDGELARTNYDSQSVSAGVRITF
jgi:outer membrane autotransporter protein